MKNDNQIFGIRAIIEAIHSGAVIDKVFIQKEAQGDLMKDLMKAIKKDGNIITENKRLLKREMKLLSKISKSDEFHIICIGNKSFEILNQILKYGVDKIWHYSAYQLGESGVKERIRQDLRRIMKRYQKT